MDTFEDHLKELVFDVVSVQSKREFARMDFLKNHCEMESYMRMGGMAMVVELRSYCMARRHESEMMYEYEFYSPSTWWQHFKDQYFYGWLLDQFPVKRSKRTVSIPQTVAYNMCPHADIAWNKSYGPHVRFMTTGEYYPGTDRVSNSRSAIP